MPAPVGGWNPDANPWTLPQTEAPVLDNFLIRPGKIVMRGAVTTLANTANVVNPLLGACGWVDSTRYSGLMVVSTKVPSATAYIDPWNVPLLKPTSAAALATTTAQNTAIGLNGSVAADSQFPSLSPRSVVFDGYRYGITYRWASTTTDAQGTYIINNTRLYLFSHAVLPGTSSAAPSGAFDIAAHLQRLWLLGGADTPGGLTPHSATTLFFTNPIAGGGGMVAADWKDPVSGLTNKIQMDQNTDDYGVGLATCSRGLVIFRRNSIWLLRGSTSASFSLQIISKEAGCLDARSIVETDSGIYFMSQRGLMMTDGARVRNMSGMCRVTLEQAVTVEQQAVLTGSGGWISCAPTMDGQIVVSIGQYSGFSVGTQPIWCGMYDPSKSAWVRLTSQVWGQDVGAAGSQYPGPLVSMISPKRLYSLGNAFVTTLEDATTGSSFVRPEVAPFGLYDVMPSGTANPGRSIPAMWTTKLAPTVGTTALSRKFSQIKRFFVDHLFAQQGLNYAGWQVQAQDSSGNVFTTQFTGAQGVAVTQPTSVVTGLATQSPHPPYSSVIQRYNSDLTNEISDLEFALSWTDVPRTLAQAQQALSMAELYGIGVEYAPTRDLR